MLVVSPLVVGWSTDLTLWSFSHQSQAKRNLAEDNMASRLYLPEQEVWNQNFKSHLHPPLFGRRILFFWS